MRRRSDDEFAVLRCLDAARTFAGLCMRVSMAERVLDRLLQRMRRAGLIEYTRKDGDKRRYWRRTSLGHAVWEKLR